MAMKVTWPSKMDRPNRTAWLAKWLKSKLAAGHLFGIGNALSRRGAYGANFPGHEVSTADKLCFGCSTCEHRQGACRRATRCGKCTGIHQTRDCHRQDPLKCAACLGQHRSSDWQCRRHPHHKRHLAVRAKMATGKRRATKSEDMELDHRYCALAMTRNGEDEITSEGEPRMK